MRAVCWEGKENIRVETVPDPVILNPRDAIVKVTTTAICGSDLHIYDGYIPTMQKGDVLGHEFMGEVVDVGKENTRLKVGDRVVVPFTIACGRCYFCKEQLWSLCDNSNPNAWMAEKLYGYSGSGLFGYSHMYGGYPGGQAEYARVPFADVGPLKVPDTLTDEQVLFLSDIFPTGYMAADELPDQARRHGGGLGLRPGRPVRDQERLSPRRRARDRDRPLRRTARTRVLTGRSRDAELRGCRRARRTAPYDRRPGSRRLHRRCRPRGARHHARCMVRPREDVDVSGHRSAARASPGDQRVPQGWDSVDSRGVRRMAGQVPLGRRIREGADAEDGSDPHAQVHADSCSSASNAARSIRLSSSRTGSVSKMRRLCIARFATNTTRASRSS